MDEIRLHKISIYSFPEDDAQVADLNRKMNVGRLFFFFHDLLLVFGAHLSDCGAIDYVVCVG
jgi:hypothetical protein